MSWISFNFKKKTTYTVLFQNGSQIVVDRESANILTSALDNLSVHNRDYQIIWDSDEDLYSTIKISEIISILKN